MYTASTIFVTSTNHIRIQYAMYSVNYYSCNKRKTYDMVRYTINVPLFLYAILNIAIASNDD